MILAPSLCLTESSDSLKYYKGQILLSSNLDNEPTLVNKCLHRQGNRTWLPDDRRQPLVYIAATVTSHWRCLASLPLMSSLQERNTWPWCLETLNPSLFTQYISFNSKKLMPQCVPLFYLLSGEVNILLVGAGDCRHILKTMAWAHRHPQRKINVSHWSYCMT